MNETPKSLRLQIGIFGRTNVGKSSFLNMVAAQDVSITSPIPGTTTDVVEKTMELLPVGPVVFLDTGGLDDTSQLAESRIAKTKKIFSRADVVILVTEPDIWGQFEEAIVAESRSKKQPLIIVINKCDKVKPKDEFVEKVKNITPYTIKCSSISKGNRDLYVNSLKTFLLEAAPDDFFKGPPIIADLIPKHGLAVLIVPIDYEAPKGRIILPQVQTIRELLDNDSASLVVKEHQYKEFLGRLKTPPDLVVCDSQVVDKMVADTPLNVQCTTFSILFSRLKGGLEEAARGVTAIDKLNDADKVLIAEACSHHAIEGDIGRIKIPKWMREYTKKDIIFEVSAGRDYPPDLSKYKLIVHCGGCMITRREMISRIQQAKQAGVPLTNYGVAISFLQGVLERVLSPFPKILEDFRKLNKKSKIKNQNL